MESFRSTKIYLKQNVCCKGKQYYSMKTVESQKTAFMLYSFRKNCLPNKYLIYLDPNTFRPQNLYTKIILKKL